MPAAVSILFGAAFTVAVSLALGKIILQQCSLPLDTSEERVFGFVVGAASLSTLVFLLCALGAAHAGVFLALGIAILAIAWRRGAFRSRGNAPAVLPPCWKWLFGAVFAAYFILYFFNAMAPEISPDGTTYHLGLVARYLRQHGFARHTDNIYASMPGGAEMLFLFAFAFGRHSAAALVHFSFLCALAWAILLYGRRFAMHTAGACGALLVFATPVVGIDAASAYNDVALACVGFALFYLLQVWQTAEKRGQTPFPPLQGGKGVCPLFSAPEPAQKLPIPCLAGLLAGFACALKYTGFVAVLYALGFLAWRSWRRRLPLWPPLVQAASASLLVMLPWMLKNWLWVANPLSPFANRIFPNPFVHLSFEQDYARLLRDPAYYGLHSLAEIPWALAVKGSLSGIVGPLYLLAPLALLALGRPAGRRLWLAGILFAAPYAANLGCRFLIPALPFLALCIAFAAVRLPGLAPALVLIHAFVCWPDIINRYFPPSTFHLRRIPIPQALRIRPEAQFLSSAVDSYPQAVLLDRLVPLGRRVLSFDPVAEAYTSREVLVVYQSALGEVARDILFVAANDDDAPTRHIQFRFPAQTWRRMRVVETGAKGSEPWSVHELRFFRNGAELPRAAAWRLRARPNPWDVQLAFDNSPVTRWRSWQPASPGMFLEVDFGAGQTVDRVRVECSPDQAGIRLRLEGCARAGIWKPVAAAVEEKTVPMIPRLRRAAIQELKTRGIDYLLIRDTNEAAAAFAGNAAAWGITEIGDAGGATLYRLE